VSNSYKLTGSLAFSLRRWQGATTLSITTFSILTPSINGFLHVTLSIKDTELYYALHNAECRCAECRILFIVILSDIILKVIMLSVVAPLAKLRH
jgi:hypothetical protein